MRIVNNGDECKTILMMSTFMKIAGDLFHYCYVVEMSLKKFTFFAVLVPVSVTKTQRPNILSYLSIYNVKRCQYVIKGN